MKIISRLKTNQYFPASVVMNYQPLTDTPKHAPDSMTTQPTGQSNPLFCYMY